MTLTTQSYIIKIEDKEDTKTKRMVVKMKLKPIKNVARLEGTILFVNDEEVIDISICDHVERAEIFETYGIMEYYDLLDEIW